MMRFLCLCVVVLSGLAAARCSLFTPEPMKAASNILRGVLANDREWREILIQVLDLEVVKSGDMLDDLGLTPEPGNGITPNAIIQRLVTHKSTTGTQLLYGIKVLGIALFSQFMKTLMVHSHLAIQFADRSEADPSAMRVGISKIQVSLSNFANKAAFFGHPIDIFRQLNDEINVFLENNKNMLNNKKTRMKSDTRDVIMKILKNVFDTAKDNVQKASHSYKDINDPMIRDIMNYLKLTGTVPNVIDKKMKSHNLYSMFTEIDDYKQVNVSSIGLKFCEKRFKVVKYIPEVQTSINE